jgi:TetR/AcrR family transcriptional regulator, cholesterol catabolism regulator
MVAVRIKATSRTRRADARREELLRAALRLFAERGVDGTTIADIAAATGTAHGLVYHYFASKNDLLLAVLERFSFVPELRRLLDVSPDRPTVDVLTEIALRFSALLRERADLLRLVSRESQTNPAVAAALGDVMAEGTRLIATYLDARVAAGELRLHDTSVPARGLFWAIVTMHLGQAPDEAFEAGLVDVLVNGLRRA